MSFFNQLDTPLPRLDHWKLNGVQLPANTLLTVLQSLLDDSLCRKVISSRPEDKRLAIHFDEARLNQSLLQQVVGGSQWLVR